MNIDMNKHNQESWTISELIRQEKEWRNYVEMTLINLLQKSGGRISLIRDSANEDYPVTTTLYGKNDYPRIDITDVYLDGTVICADGNEEGTDIKRTGLQIYPEQLSDILLFVTNVLNQADACSSKEKSAKLTLEEIQAEYHKSEVCMAELLAYIPARGLNMEEAFELNIAARKWADGDEFYRVIEDGKPEKL